MRDTELQSEEDIAKYTVSEELSDTKKVMLLLTTGTPEQQTAVLLPSILGDGELGVVQRGDGLNGDSVAEAVCKSHFKRSRMQCTSGQLRCRLR